MWLSELKSAFPLTLVCFDCDGEARTIVIAETKRCLSRQLLAGLHGMPVQPDIVFTEGIDRVIAGGFADQSDMPSAYCSAVRGENDLAEVSVAAEDDAVELGTEALLLSSKRSVGMPDDQHASPRRLVESHKV